MTGFGRGEISRDGRTVSVEMKSVNNRYLDLSVRLPHSMNPLEEAVKSAVSSRIARGHVDVFIRYQNTRSDAKSITIDKALLDAYRHAFSEVELQTGWNGEMEPSVALKLPDVLRVEEAPEDEEALKALLLEALNTAIDQLIDMRTREGARMASDIGEKLDELAQCVDAAKERSPQVVQAHADALRSRIQELLAEIPIDEARMANEIAIYVDKAAVDEEMARLESHITQMREYLGSDVPVGRQMDFLTQELNREVNTLCSKANDAEMTRIGLAGKNIVEKIREQVQNIE